jgi:predicted CoA-binding protein
VVDHDAFERTTEAGVPMVMDTCPAIEWPRVSGNR